MQPRLCSCVRGSRSTGESAYPLSRFANASKRAFEYQKLERSCERGKLCGKKIMRNYATRKLTEMVRRHVTSPSGTVLVILFNVSSQFCYNSITWRCNFKESVYTNKFVLFVQKFIPALICMMN